MQPCMSTSPSPSEVLYVLDCTGYTFQDMIRVRHAYLIFAFACLLHFESKTSKLWKSCCFGPSEKYLYGANILYCNFEGTREPTSSGRLYRGNDACATAFFPEETMYWNEFVTVEILSKWMQVCQLVYPQLDDIRGCFASVGRIQKNRQ